MSGFENFWAIYGNLVLTLGTNALLALSIWLTLACGMLAMANAAFMGIGAYAAALLTMNYDASFPVALAGGMLAPALVAALIGLPTLRLSGVYLAMATLGFGEVVRVTVLNTESITGGALGLNGIPQLTQWWHVILAVVIVLFVLWRVRVQDRPRLRRHPRRRNRRRPDGHRRARQQDAGIRGGRHDRRLGGRAERSPDLFIGPNEYGFDRGVEILTMAILGGIGGLAGPVLGSFIITVLPEMLRGFADFRLVVNGVILVVIVLFLPQGIWDPARFKRWMRQGGKRHA